MNPSSPPMGCLDAFDVGSQKMTIQTEFFPSPEWHIETKIYHGGALKKVFSEDAVGVAEGELQSRLNDFHQTNLKAILEKVKGMQK